MKLSQNQSGNTLIGTVLYAVFGIIFALVTLRFVFELLGANPTNQFVDLIYGYSGPFVAPFNGIFNQPGDIPNGGYFDVAALVAMAVYGIIGSLVSNAAGRSR